MHDLNRDSDGKFWHRLGFIAGFFTAIFLMATAFAFNREYTASKFSELLWNWQTLIAGLVALGGALLTVYVLKQQIALQLDLEADQRKRRHYAARSAMPAALSEMRQYTSQSFGTLKAIAPHEDATGRILHAAPWAAPPAPKIPSEALAVFRTCIESAEVENMQAIAEIIKLFQILHARLINLVMEVSPGSSTIVTRWQLNERIAETLEFDVRCNNMFEYARRRSDTATTEITQGDVSNRAFFLDFHEDIFPGLAEIIERRFSHREGQLP